MPNISKIKLPNENTSRELKDTTARAVFTPATSSASGTQGQVPAPTYAEVTAGKFLKADGTWDTPAGGTAPTGDDILLTGYTQGSDTTAVVATDKVNEAIAKHENKIALNQTNILSVETQLANLQPALPKGRLTMKANDLVDNNWETAPWLDSKYYFDSAYIWTDGTDIYYSNGSSQYVLNKTTSTWSIKSWSGLTSFYGSGIWTDGTDIYYSSGSTQKVLDKSTSTWSDKTWSGYTSISGSSIWTDGTDIYYSDGSSQYVLEHREPITTVNDVLDYVNDQIGNINSVLEAVL